MSAVETEAELAAGDSNLLLGIDSGVERTQLAALATLDGAACKLAMPREVLLRELRGRSLHDQVELINQLLEGLGGADDRMGIDDPASLLLGVRRPLLPGRQRPARANGVAGGPLGGSNHPAAPSATAAWRRHPGQREGRGRAAQCQL